VPVSRRRGLVLIAAVAAVALGGGLWAGSGSDRPALGRAPTGPTALIRRDDVVTTEIVYGTLGYEGHGAIVNRVQGPVTVTRLPPEGSIVGPGGELYRVNDRPVILMLGRMPAYRDLSVGARGDDVRQLDRGLAALGFGRASPVDAAFDAATAEAVRGWQRSLGLRPTGRVELGRVVFLPERARIGSHAVREGQPLTDGAEVAAVTSTSLAVHLELRADLRPLASEGDTATVVLPDGRSLPSRITSVGEVPHPSEEVPAEAGTPTGADRVVDVSIRLPGARGLRRYGEATVQVRLASQVARDVLTVPVTALLSTHRGYAVEVLAGGSRRQVPVRVGLFSEGLVEVWGPGIREGMRVAVAR
jgi:peptidoglycan hydrolase-like protein with peptidoglycan-binding domain